MNPQADEDLQRKAERLLGLANSLSSEERERLITKVEAVLNARLGIEREMAHDPRDPQWTREVWERHMWRRSFELYQQTAELAAELVGRTILELALPDDGDEPEELRSGLIRRLRLARPFLAVPAGWSPKYRQIMDELQRLIGGDEPSIFAPTPRLRGQSPRPMLVAQHRLRGLAWAEHLRARGVPTAEWKQAVVTAYGAADWDTIRKWRTPCEDMFGVKEVEAELQYGSNRYWGSYTGDDWLQELREDGELYQAVWREERNRKR